MYQRPWIAEVSGRHKNTTTISKLLDQLDSAYFYSATCFPGKTARGDKNDKLVIERITESQNHRMVWVGRDL